MHYSILPWWSHQEVVNLYSLQSPAILTHKDSSLKNQEVFSGIWLEPCEMVQEGDSLIEFILSVWKVVVPELSQRWCYEEFTVPWSWFQWVRISDSHSVDCYRSEEGNKTKETCKPGSRNLYGILGSSLTSIIWDCGVWSNAVLFWDVAFLQCDKWKPKQNNPGPHLLCVSEGFNCRHEMYIYGTNSAIVVIKKL